MKLLAFGLFLLLAFVGRARHDVSHQDVEILWEVNHGRRVVESHVAERDEILAESKPAEGHVVAEQPVLEKEDNQSNCARN